MTRKAHTSDEAVKSQNIVVGKAGIEGKTRIKAGFLACDSFVRTGIELWFLEDIVNDGSVTLKEIHTHIIPKRTLSHREVKGERLSPAESEKALRFARVVAMAEETFGNKEKAHAWLRRETKPLDNRKPLDLLDTEVGGRAVENLLNRIDHGFAA